MTRPATTNEVLSAYFMWSRSNAAAPFNAWLDQVKADAWDEGAAHVDEWLLGGPGYKDSETALRNPYRSEQ